MLFVWCYLYYSISAKEGLFPPVVAHWILSYKLYGSHWSHHWTLREHHPSLDGWSELVRGQLQGFNALNSHIRPPLLNIWSCLITRQVIVSFSSVLKPIGSCSVGLQTEVILNPSRRCQQLNLDYMFLHCDPQLPSLAHQPILVLSVITFNSESNRKCCPFELPIRLHCES